MRRGGERGRGRFVRARVRRNVETETLLGRAQEGPYRPVACLASVAEDLTTILSSAKGRSSFSSVCGA